MNSDLYDNIISLRNAGVEISISTLQISSKLVLEKFGKTNLLKENGGKLTFSSSWCSKWFKKHKFTLRKATQGVYILLDFITTIMFILYLLILKRKKKIVYARSEIRISPKDRSYSGRGRNS